MVTSRSPYVILSITPASPFCAFIQDFSCKPSEIPRRIGERDEEGKHGKKKRSDFDEIKCVYPQLATFGLCAKL